MRRSVRIYRDNLGILCAENLAEMDKAGITEHKPEWNIRYEQKANVIAIEFYLLFDGIDESEAKLLISVASNAKVASVLGGQKPITAIPELVKAIADEGTRANLQDKEEYYGLIFEIHPSQTKYRKRMSDEIREAIEAQGGWMNPIIQNHISPNSFRYDMSVSKPNETKEALAKVMKRNAVKKWDFFKNDF